MDSVAQAKAAVKALMTEKDKIEAEVEAITTRLRSGPNAPGLSGNLVDKEGFPRADIDIAVVRQDRQRLACLTNDHKVIMKQIDQALIDLHSLSRPQGGTGLHAPAELAPMPGQITASTRTTQNGTQGHAQGDMEADLAVPLVPFAIVDEVADASPATAAGIQVGDYMVSFGGVQHAPDVTAPEGKGSQLLPAVAQVLAENEGRQVPTVLSRNGTHISMTLTPQKWAGRGLLGCHLKPL